MKKLTDYKNDDAIELWADLLDPLSIIITDKAIQTMVQSGKPKMEIVKEMLKKHKKEAVQILLRIDDTPVDGLNIITRLMTVISDIGDSEEAKHFFGYAEQAKTENESSGLPTENTKAKEK